MKFSWNKNATMITAVALLWTIAGILLVRSELGQQWRHRVVDAAEFKVRTMLGKNPVVHPRLKILGFDDRALAQVQRPELLISEWTELLHSIQTQKPKMILIDKMFGYTNQASAEELAAFQREVRRANNVIVGSFLTNFRIPGREMIHIRERFPASLLARRDLPMRPYVYGPHADLVDSFRGVGHFLYEGDGRIAPFYRVDAETILPHVTVYAAQLFGESDRALRLPVDRDGRVHVDFLDPKDAYGSTYSLSSVLKRVADGRPIDLIEKGDIVLILPLLYTGNTDVLDTPHGRLPAGYILASQINSMLNNKFIRTPKWPLAVVAILALLGAIVGHFFNPGRFWLGAVVMILAISACGLLAFAYEGARLPWAEASHVFLGAGLTLHGLRMRRLATEASRMREGLRGLVPEPKLREIVAGPHKLYTEASERVVTLMFVDIVHFSTMAESQSPKAVFMELREILHQLIDIVHEHGGTVDKTIGDGLLCFFGYSYDGQVVENQADAAINCAIAMQKANVKRCLRAAREGRPVLPLRIGINTGAVYIGDIGGGGRIDFTVIGSGVNFAQRLEAACEPNAIMMSGTTADFAIRHDTRGAGFRRRHVPIKHMDELIEAIEFNPFHNHPQMLADLHREQRKGIESARAEQRWPVPNSAVIALSSTAGSAELVDFSKSGFCVALGRYLARGVQIRLQINNEALRHLLLSQGIDEILCEVRWARSGDGRNLHGLRFANLSENQAAHLIDCLRSEVRRSKARPVSIAQSA